MTEHRKRDKTPILLDNLWYNVVWNITNNIPVIPIDIPISWLVNPHPIFLFIY